MSLSTLGCGFILLSFTQKKIFSFLYVFLRRKKNLLYFLKLRSIKNITSAPETTKNQETRLKYLMQISISPKTSLKRYRPETTGERQEHLSLSSNYFIIFLKHLKIAGSNNIIFHDLKILTVIHLFYTSVQPPGSNEYHGDKR